MIGRTDVSLAYRLTTTGNLSRRIIQPASLGLEARRVRRPNDLLKMEPASSSPCRPKVALSAPGIQRQRRVWGILGKGSKVWLFFQMVWKPLLHSFSTFPLYMGPGEPLSTCYRKIKPDHLRGLFPFCAQAAASGWLDIQGWGNGVQDVVTLLPAGVWRLRLLSLDHTLSWYFFSFSGTSLLVV